MNSKILPFVEQPDAVTCQAACVAKAVGTQDVMGVRRALLRIGNPGSPSVMGQYLKPRVKSYKFNPIASLNDAAQWLEKPNRMVITHGWFTRSGHVISLVEISDRPNNRGFIVDDPWCEFDFPNWRYIYSKSGDNVRYSRFGLYASCVAGQSVSDALRIYQRGELDSNLKNAWMHFIEN